jgi:hypothetical protein
MHRLAIFVLLLPSWVAAEPAPVFANVDSTHEGGQSSLDLRQDRCYTWGQPSVVVESGAVQVTQSVTPIANCALTGTSNESIALGTFAVGSYRLTYTPTPVGFGPMPVSVLDFNVRPDSVGRLLDIEPLEPVALEPVEAHFELESGCEWISGFRVIEGGFRIELARDESIDPFVCDGIVLGSVTIGAFPPGSYRVELASPEDEGGAVLGTAEFHVRPGFPDFPASKPAALPDQSGFWTSPNEEPRTGISIIQSRIPGVPGVTPPIDAIAGIWYRYNDDGSPAWLWVDATSSGIGSSSYTGTVTRYDVTNVGAPPWQRVVAGTSVGTIAVSFGGLDQPAHVTAVIDGETIEFSLQRFRWLRSAWPEVQ